MSSASPSPAALATAAAGLAALGALAARVLRRPASRGSEPDAPADANASTAALWRLLGEQWERDMRRRPVLGTLRGDPSYDHLLGDPSSAAGVEQGRAARALLRRLAREVDRAELSDADAVSLDLVTEALETDAEEAEHQPWHLAINQLLGPHISLARLVALQRVRTLEEARRFAARLRAFLPQVDALRRTLREGVARGRTQPNFIVPLLAEQCEAHVAAGAAPEDSVFYRHVDAACAKWDGAPAWEAAEARRLTLEAVRGSVLPGYRLLARFFRGEYQAAARPDAGLWAVAGGEAFYAFLVRKYTTTRMTPDEVHAVGLETVRRLKAEIVELLAAQGYAGDFAAQKVLVAADKSLFFTSKEEVKAAYETALDAITPLLPQYFGIMPRAGYEVREMEPYAERSGPPAMYYPATQDGSRPGIFYINTYKPEERPRYSVETISYHEGVPGHHLQVAIQQELEGLPRFRTNAIAGPSSYLEGWGLYCEAFPREAGIAGCYTDPMQVFGQLNAEIWRACRLVVDTGVHHLRWTREQARAFLRENSFLAEVEVNTEVDRYIAFPGQACSYYIGVLKMRELRQAAMDALGDRFDYRDFHDQILACGAVPLTILERRVHAWLDRVR